MLFFLTTFTFATVLANVQYAVPPSAPQYPTAVQYPPQQVPVPAPVPVFNYPPVQQVIVQPQPQPQQYTYQVGNRATVTNCKACAWCCVGNVPIRRVPIASPPQPQPQVYTYQQQPTRQVVYNQVVSRPQPQISYAPIYTPQQPPQQQVISRPAPVPVYYPRPPVVPPQPQVYTQAPPVYAPYQVPQVYNQTSYVQSPPTVPVPTPCQYVAPPPPTTTQGYVAPPQQPPCQTTTTTTIPFYVTPTTTTTTTTTTPPPPLPFYQTAPPQDQYETPATYATLPPPTSTYIPPPPKSSYVQPPTYVPVPLPAYRTNPFDFVGGESKNCCYLKIHNVEATLSCGTTGTQCCTNPLSTCENARNVTVHIPRELLNLPPTVITCEEAVRRGFITTQIFEGLCPATIPTSPSTEIHIPSTHEPTGVVPTSYVLPGSSGLENSSTISTITAALTIVIAMFL